MLPDGYELDVIPRNRITPPPLPGPNRHPHNSSHGLACPTVTVANRRPYPLLPSNRSGYDYLSYETTCFGSFAWAHLGVGYTALYLDLGTGVRLVPAVALAASGTATHFDCGSNNTSGKTGMNVTRNTITDYSMYSEDEFTETSAWYQYRTRRSQEHSVLNGPRRCGGGAGGDGGGDGVCR